MVRTMNAGLNDPWTAEQFLDWVALPRQNRKLAFTRANMPATKLERIANNRMDAEHAGLDALMDD